VTYVGIFATRLDTYRAVLAVGLCMVATRVGWSKLSWSSVVLSSQSSCVLKSVGRCSSIILFASAIRVLVVMRKMRPTLRPVALYAISRFVKGPWT